MYIEDIYLFRFCIILKLIETKKQLNKYIYKVKNILMMINDIALVRRELEKN